ncbi:MAG: hypothetical protein Q8L14_30405 [Myxococcales bacterium]|nr:hypothetical protein [Myxococcales bacterium]
MSSRALLVCVVVFVACGPPSPVARKVGERAPSPAECDAQDDTRCLLPWPNNTFTVADSSTPTGLRVSVQRRALPNPDAPEPLNRLDGFSVIGALAVGFKAPITVRTDARPATAMRLFRATPGDTFGEEVALRLSVVKDGDGSSSLLIGYPLRPMEPSTDYVAVVVDEVPGVEAPRRVKVLAGVDAPTTDEERALVAFHAPLREVLAKVGVAPARVLRAWEFTTRSAKSVRAPFEAMRQASVDAAAAGELVVTVDRANAIGTDSLEVRGVVAGLPRFTKATGELALDASGAPMKVGVHQAPFRVVLPKVTRPYPVVIFGHGTGGTAFDDTFDADILGAGAAKLNLQYDGWTESTVLETLVGLDKRFTGSERSTGRLLQSLADASAIEASLSGALGDALSQPMVLGQQNPAAGVREDPSRRVYAGGSLGGTLGFVHTLTEPSVRASVLNVPGAGWTHFVPTSGPFSTLDELFATTTPSAVDRALSVVMTQGSWDPVDGAAWAATGARADVVMLLQESMGDPVLPNIGTHLVATSSRAVQVGAVLEPVEGVTPVTQASGRTALTQFRIPNGITDLIARHGFGGKNTLAGVAAREQIRAFLDSVWAGAPLITVPATCTRAGLNSCDFGEFAP